MNEEIVGPDQLFILTNLTCSSIGESIALGYASAEEAWNAASNSFGYTMAINEGSYYTNAGWVKGTMYTNEGWNAYLWALKNQIAFMSSTSQFWVSENGKTNVIAKVLVGSLGDYAPMTTNISVGPVSSTNGGNYLEFPGVGGAEDAVIGVDVRAFYAVLKIDMVTPAGDPVNAAVQSGDGQNEFTYSTASPGVLTMNLKAHVTPSGMANQIKDQCLFTVDTIAGSTLAWDVANPGGKPTASGDDLLATVTFTGLPANNTAFGSKKAAIYFNASKQDEENYEVFFTNTAANHPSGTATDPNWFYYWKQAMGPTYLIYDSSATYAYYDSVNDKIVFYVTCGFLNARTGHEGIDAFAEYLMHEETHRAHYFETSGGTVSDYDRDWATDSRETYGDLDQDGTIESETADEGLRVLVHRKGDSPFYALIGAGNGVTDSEWTGGTTSKYDWNTLGLYLPFGDDEYYAEHAEDNWVVGWGDSYDWGNPGKNAKPTP